MTTEERLEAIQTKYDLGEYRPNQHDIKFLLDLVKAVEEWREIAKEFDAAVSGPGTLPF